MVSLKMWSSWATIIRLIFKIQADEVRLNNFKEYQMLTFRCELMEKIVERKKRLKLLTVKIE